MAHTNDQEDDVIIIDADFSMLNKIGKNNLHKVMSASAIAKAQILINDAAHDFYTDCVSEAEKLQKVIGRLSAKAVPQDPTLKNVISTAFAIKTKSGQAGFDLVADLAKSLHVMCEETTETLLTPPLVKIIAWYGSSIQYLLSAKVKGAGGETGKAILVEVERLKAVRLNV